MKTIFLDIDGVLATQGAWGNPGYMHGRAKEFYLPAQSALEELLARQPHVSLVLSSVWRQGSNWRERIAKESPLIASRIVGTTSVSGNGFRGGEVSLYADAFGLKDGDYLILDDSSDFTDRQRKYHIKPETAVGLNAFQAKQMEFLLGLENIASSCQWYPMFPCYGSLPEVPLPKDWAVVENAVVMTTSVRPDYQLLLTHLNDDHSRAIVPIVTWTEMWWDDELEPGETLLIGSLKGRRE